MKEPSWLLRVIECFRNETQEPVSESVLPPVPLPELQQKWGLPPDAPLVECLYIGEQQAGFFRDLVGITFDFSRYSYFLTAYTTDLEATKREGGFMGLFPPPRELPALPEAGNATSD
jgi:hypothetical protein